MRKFLISIRRLADKFLISVSFIKAISWICRKAKICFLIFAAFSNSKFLLATFISFFKPLINLSVLPLNNIFIFFIVRLYSFSLILLIQVPGQRPICKSKQALPLFIFSGE